MQLSFICDFCEKEIEGSSYGYPENGDACEKCYLKGEIKYKESLIKEKIEWLKITHYKQIKIWKIELKELEKSLEIIKRG